MERTRPDHAEIRLHAAFGGTIFDIAEQILIRQVRFENDALRAALRLADQQINHVSPRRPRLASRTGISITEKHLNLLKHVFAHLYAPSRQPFDLGEIGD
jgi:hypothetical protein